MQETARHHAITEKQGDRRLDQDEYMDEEMLKLRRMSPRGKDPDFEDAMHGYKFHADRLDELQDVLNNQFNYPDSEVRAAQKALPMARRMKEQARKNAEKIIEMKAAERNQAVQK